MIQGIWSQFVDYLSNSQEVSNRLIGERLEKTNLKGPNCFLKIGKYMNGSWLILSEWFIFVTGISFLYKITLVWQSIRTKSNNLFPFKLLPRYFKYKLFIAVCKDVCKETKVMILSWSMKIAAVRLPHCPEEADLFIPAAFRPESSIKAEPVCGGIQLGTKPLIAEMCKLQTTVQLMALVGLANPRVGIFEVQFSVISECVSPHH